MEEWGRGVGWRSGVEEWGRGEGESREQRGRSSVGNYGRVAASLVGRVQLSPEHTQSELRITFAVLETRDHPQKRVDMPLKLR